VYLVIFFFLLDSVFCGSDKDFGITWGKRARRSCLRMAINRHQSSICESLQEAVEDAFTGQGNQYAYAGIGQSSVSGLWERAETSPWKEAVEKMVLDLSEWALQIGETRTEKISNFFYQPFLSFLIKLAAGDLESLAKDPITFPLAAKSLVQGEKDDL